LNIYDIKILGENLKTTLILAIAMILLAITAADAKLSVYPGMNCEYDNFGHPTISASAMIRADQDTTYSWRINYEVFFGKGVDFGSTTWDDLWHTWGEGGPTSIRKGETQTIEDGFIDNAEPRAKWVRTTVVVTDMVTKEVINYTYNMTIPQLA